MDGVVMVVNKFVPLQVGGAERQAERLSAYLAKHDWSVTVITHRAPGLPASETRRGFRIIRPATYGPGKAKTVSFVLGALFTLWRLRKSYSIIHAHLSFGSAFAAVLASRLFGKRVIVKFGNSGEFGDVLASQNTWRGRLRLAVLRRWADIVIVLDDTMQSEALSAGFDPRRVRKMVNGIDTSEFAPATMRYDVRANLDLNGKVVVLFVGRLSPQKSLHNLIRAFAVALKTCPELYLLILGDGPERASLQNLTSSLQIIDQVKFAGNQDDVRSYLAAADLFVLPSKSEGISNSLLEAMSSGLPCLASEVGGTSEVLDYGRCGLLLPVDDVSAWSSALVTLGRSKNMREQLGIAARKRICNNYDLDVVGARYKSLYAELLAAFQSPPVDLSRGVQ